MKAQRDHFIRSATDWLFRRRSPALAVMRFGLTSLTLSLGAGWALDVSLPIRDGTLDLSFSSAGGTPAIVVYGAGILGIVLLGSGLVYEVIRYKAEQRRLARKKVIVIEARGLRDTSGTPLIDAVPETLEGQREQVLVDLRQRVMDGKIISPEAAVERLASLPADIDQRERGLDRRDVIVVYGGLAPVPLTFLTGVLLDDEGAVTVMDWDRHTNMWRQLDGVDDGRRFAIDGVETLPPGTLEVAIAVSVSYGVDVEGVRAVVGDMALVTMTLESGTPDCHWSEDKQKALGRQFLETVIALGNNGGRRIHLFLAAQNSIVFRFGRLYDTRNLPEVVVYQYQREEKPPYPWALCMPVSGATRAEVRRAVPS